MTTIKDVYEVESKASGSGIDQATKEVTGLGKALQTVGKIGAAPFNAIKGGISGIGKVVGAVGKGLAVFHLALKGIQDIGRIVGGAIDALRKQSPALDTALTSLQNKAADLFGPVLGALGNALTPIFEKLLAVISSPEFKQFVDTITKVLIKGIQDLMPFIDSLIGFLMKIVKAIDTGDWSEVWNTIRTVAETAWNNFVAWLGPALNTFFTVTVPAILAEFVRIFTMAWETFWNVTVPAAWNTFKQLFQMAWDGFWNGVSTLAQGIWLGLQTAWNNFWSGLTAGIEGAINWLQGKSNAASSIASGIAAGGAAGAAGALPKFAAGGIVNRPMLAMIGDSPKRKGGEVVSPVSDLMGMIKQATLGGMVVNVYGPFGTGYTPAQAGAQAGDAIVNKMRARGLNV